MPRKLSPAIGCGCAALSSFAFVTGAAAQGVIAPPPLDFSGRPPNVSNGRTNQFLEASSLGEAQTSALGPFWQWGPVNFRPHALYRFLYGDGVPSRPGQRTTTAINEFYPGMLFGLGPHWNLDYTPSFFMYSSSQFRNVIDQSVSLTGATAYRDWTFGLSQSYFTSDQPLIETGSQTSTENYRTSLSAGYQFNEKLSLELSLSQNFQFIGDNSAGQSQYWQVVGGNSVALSFQDTRDWSSMDWLNYQLLPRLGVALGVGGGYTELTSSTSSEITSEQLQGRINWRTTDKLNLVASVGGDDRQFLSGNQPDLINPIFSVSAIYQPFDVTTLSLTASRLVSPSYFQSQLSETTEVSADFHQRLLQKLTLGLLGGYRDVNYVATTSTLSTSRTDHYTFVNVRLSAPFFKRGTASLLYQVSENSSSQGGYTYTSTQVGVELGYRF